MPEIPDFWLFVISQVFTAGAVYGGIRIELRWLHRRDSEIEKKIDTIKHDVNGEVTSAHKRIDAMLMERRAVARD